MGFNFEKFFQDMGRLDTLYYDALGQENKYLKWEVVSKPAIISWSVNGGTQLLCQQGCMKAKHLGAQPSSTAYSERSHSSCWGLRGVVITKELLNSTQCGRQRYHTYLEERQTEKEKKDKGAIGNLKRKKWYT